jgi:hypothetical protein
MRLIGDDIAATIALGGLQSAAGPTYGATVSIKAVGIDFDAEIKADTVKFKAFADTVNSYRVVATEGTVSLTFYVPAAGAFGSIVVGQYAKFLLTPLSTLTASLETYAGVITSRKISGASGQEQKETLTIMANAE